MIKKADVGIGIYGKEGYQAITASDYAICEFQFLRRLMFIHGRNNNRRFRTFFTHFLSKSLIFCVGPLIFAFDNLFSGQTYYEVLYAIIFNFITMNLIIIFYGIYETDINPNLEDKTTNLLLPYLYEEGRRIEMFEFFKFLKWYAYCGYVGAVNYLINYFSYYNAVVGKGQSFGFWQFSFTSYTTIMGINLIIVGNYVRTWN